METRMKQNGSNKTAKVLTSIPATGFAGFFLPLLPFLTKLTKNQMNRRLKEKPRPGGRGFSVSDSD